MLVGLAFCLLPEDEGWLDSGAFSVVLTTGTASVDLQWPTHFARCWEEWQGSPRIYGPTTFH